MNYEIETLMDAAKSIKPNDLDSLKVLSNDEEYYPGMFCGTAFFPYGKGVWKNVKFPIGGIMVLGHDFGHTPYIDSCKKESNKYVDEDLEGKTWKGISNWFGIYGDLFYTNAFFTNAYMGIRNDKTKITGEINRGKDFTKKCYDILKLQIDKQQPKVIFTLGIAPFKALENTYSFFKYDKTFRTFKVNDLTFVNHVDKNPIHEIDFGFGYSTKIIALKHPSARNPKSRNFQIDHNSLIDEGLSLFK
ncbi:MAG: uracil-DNA glycosylase family protein [Bacteroidota bacterium]